MLFKLNFRTWGRSNAAYVRWHKALYGRLENSRCRGKLYTYYRGGLLDRYNWARAGPSTIMIDVPDSSEKHFVTELRELAEKYRDVLSHLDFEVVDSNLKGDYLWRGTGKQYWLDQAKYQNKRVRNQ